MWRHTSITTWIFLWVLYTRSSHYWLIIHEKLLNLPWVRLFWQCRLFEKKKINMQDIGPAPNNFLQDLLKLCRTWIFPWRKSFEEVKILRLFFRTGIYKILNLNESVMGTIKTQPTMFSNINTRNGRIDASQPV